MPLELAAVREAYEQCSRHAGARHRQPRPEQRHLHSRVLFQVQCERRGVVGPVGLGPERVGWPAVLLLPAGRDAFRSALTGSMGARTF